MSHYVDVKTSITDEECLTKALCRVENGHDCYHRTWDKSHIESHKQAMNLYGYKGDMRTDKANVIIRRKNVGRASNDLGFVKNADGSYTAIISEFDGRSMGFSSVWLQRLTTYYGVEKAKKEFKARGIKYTETTDEKGRVQLKAQVKGGMYG